MYTQSKSRTYGGLADFWGAVPRLSKEMIGPLPHEGMATIGPSPEAHDPLIGPVPVVPAGMPIVPGMIRRAPQVVMVQGESEKMPPYLLPAILIFLISLIIFKKK